jgi:hypothetical protein
MSLVSRLISKYRELGFSEGVRDPEMGFLARNIVTGWAINVPIALTCQPTKTCVKSCYFAKGKTGWPDNLKKQTQVYWSIEKDPFGTAQHIVTEFHDKKAKFLRWNGGGDLTPNAVKCINEMVRIDKSIPIWVVTRKPKVAIDLVQSDNLFVHFSVDRSSKNRLEKWISLTSERANPCNWFASYQVDNEEEIAFDIGESGFSVVFLNDYKGDHYENNEMCPLNYVDSANGIKDTCKNCGRCWSDKAVGMRNIEKLKQWLELKEINPLTYNLTAEREEKKSKPIDIFDMFQ